MLFEIFHSIFDIFQILKNELIVNDLHVSDGIHRVFSMGDVLVFECSNYVVNSVNFSDVTEEVVAEALALGRAPHNTCDIDDLKNG